MIARPARLASVAAGMAACLAGWAAEAAVPGEYRYRIEHPRYGRIGTYVNRISPEGETTTVETRVRIAVKLAFVTVFRLEADRRETWRDGRLVAFSGTTDNNGKTTQLEGRAEGDRFVLNGPRGSATAPAAVWPANPWSPDVLRAPAIMSTAAGRVSEPKVSGGEEEPVEAAGRVLRAKHYRIVTNQPSDVWFDAEGRLVKFTTVEDDDIITLTLE